ncbi:lipoyl protein ligase domain-containing protein [Sinomonas halotolerans]|uniref:Lipoate--protein ligase family protein n=1 Tax=Sinomonas halotolerans TaxID=1644133 RepID=A0ABU9X2F1_9MICC
MPSPPTAAPFGSGPVGLVQAAGERPGAEDMDLVHERLAALGAGGLGELNIVRPASTAAFSRLDSRLPGYEAARAALAARGFEPIIRPVGGHLAVYGPGDLVVHLWAPHPDARSQIRERFMLFGEAVAGSLRELGVDTRIGAVPGEYCTGEYSVNRAGTAKLAGTGQRLTRHGYLFSAVLMVERADAARAALEEAYSLLGLEFAPESVGCVADAVPGATADSLRHTLAAAVGRLVPLSPRTSSSSAPSSALASPSGLPPASTAIPASAIS